MSLINSLNEEFSFKNNLVVSINGTNFAKYQPDSGLVIDEDKLIVDGASINPTQIDLRRATTQINSTTVKVLDGTPDFDFVFSAFIGADPNALIGSEISIKFGRVNEDIDFSEYIEISKYIITDINKAGNFYNIKAKSQEDRTLKPAFQQQGTLNTSINDSILSWDVETDEDVFPATGFLRIDNEFVEYTGTAFNAGITTFTIQARGDLLSTPESHTAGAQVNYVKELVGNPIDLLLDLLTGTDGAEIDPTLVDVAAFESIRDTNFPTDIFTLYPSNIPVLIEYIEKELLEANNIRIVKNSLNNLISISLLDVVDPSQDVEEIDDSTTLINTPKWSVSKNEVQTVVKVQWNWVEGLQKFTRSRTIKASDEIIAIFGEINGPTLSFKGIQEADNGATIAVDRARRYLNRFSTPKATVSLSAFSTEFKHTVGDKVRITAKHLPAEGGGLGMSSVLELVSRAANTSTGVIKLGFRFTSYTNIRNGLISPSDVLRLSITSQQEFEVSDGSLYKVGYVMRLLKIINGKWVVADSPNAIAEINGNIITMENDFTTTLGADTAFIFADYNEVNEEQKAKFQFIVNNTDFFSDGSKGYQIIF